MYYTNLSLFLKCCVAHKYNSQGDSRVKDKLQRLVYFPVTYNKYRFISIKYPKKDKNGQVNSHF